MGAKLLITASGALLLVIASAASWAQDLVTVGQAGDIQGRTVLKQAQLAEAEVDKKLKDLADGKSASTSGQSGQNIQPYGVPAYQQQLTAKAAVPSEAPPPVVFGVFGAKGHEYATFLYANNSSIDGHVGEKIPGGYVVTSVSVERVEITRNGQKIQLGFSQSAPVQPVSVDANASGGQVISGPFPLPGPIGAPPYTPNAR